MRAVFPPFGSARFAWLLPSLEAVSRTPRCSIDRCFSAGSGCSLGMGEGTASASGVDAFGLDLGGGLLALLVLMAAPGNAFRFHPD